jgi:hypothetical protein
MYYLEKGWMRANKADRTRKARGCMRGGRAIDLQGPVGKVAGAGYDASGVGYGGETQAHKTGTAGEILRKLRGGIGE